MDERQFNREYPSSRSESFLLAAFGLYASFTRKTTEGGLSGQAVGKNGSSAARRRTRYPSKDYDQESERPEKMNNRSDTVEKLKERIAFVEAERSEFRQRAHTAETCQSDRVTELEAKVAALEAELAAANRRAEIAQGNATEAAWRIETSERERIAAHDRAVRFQAERDQARAEIENLKRDGFYRPFWEVRWQQQEDDNNQLREQLGQLRLCVNCGTYADATKVKRGDELPDCVDPETGLSACTFDLTPLEAVVEIRNQREEANRKAEILCAGLRYIASFSETAMKHAKTLHYDMRGRARQALDQAGYATENKTAEIDPSADPFGEPASE